MDLVRTTPSSEVLAAAAKALQAMMASPEVQVAMSPNGLVVGLWLSVSCSQLRAEMERSKACNAKC